MSQQLLPPTRAGLALVLAYLVATGQLQAQTTSASSNLVAQPIPDRTILYGVAATGTAKPMLFGLDTAWPDDNNMLRGIAFMGPDKVNLVRLSFQPTYPLVNGDLQQPQINDLNNRLRLLNFNGSATQVTFNCDAPQRGCLLQGQRRQLGRHDGRHRAPRAGHRPHGGVGGALQ